jgi:hypothetical protein
MTSADRLVDRIREACSTLPEVEERPSHGAPTFFVRGKKSFVSVWVDGHHDNEFPHLWCAAPAGTQAELIAGDPDTFFRPPYVGHRGWLGVRTDRGIEDAELRELCQEAYRTVAPAALVARLDDERASGRGT